MKLKKSDTSTDCPPGGGSLHNGAKKKMVSFQNEFKFVMIFFGQNLIILDTLKLMSVNLLVNC